MDAWAGRRRNLPGRVEPPRFWPEGCRWPLSAPWVTERPVGEDPLCGHSLRSAATAYDCIFAKFARRLLQVDHRLTRVIFRAYYAPKTSAGTTRWTLGGWLRELGLQHYEQAFRGNEIELHVLPLAEFSGPGPTPMGVKRRRELA